MTPYRSLYIQPTSGRDDGRDRPGNEDRGAQEAAAGNCALSTSAMISPQDGLERTETTAKPDGVPDRVPPVRRRPPATGSCPARELVRLQRAQGGVGEGSSRWCGAAASPPPAPAGPASAGRNRQAGAVRCRVSCGRLGGRGLARLASHRAPAPASTDAPPLPLAVAAQPVELLLELRQALVRRPCHCRPASRGPRSRRRWRPGCTCSPVTRTGAATAFTKVVKSSAMIGCASAGAPGPCRATGWSG